MGRRCAIDSITGLPNPSHVDGNTTRSAAAYASATDGARPTVTGTGDSRHEPREHVVVSVLGGTGDPQPDLRVAGERGELGGEGDRPGHVLARDRARRLDEDEIVGCEPERRARRVPVAAYGVELERVADRDRVEAAVAELVARVVVDRHVQ